MVHDLGDPLKASSVVRRVVLRQVQQLEAHSPKEDLSKPLSDVMRSFGKKNVKLPEIPSLAKAVGPQEAPDTKEDT
ncbi:hypothetical protein JQX13_39075 [Archangium violaceum]|uniref:hypothetical protein n=1 Tax=Archangium violaceum TaxID=83451 RepID=UPI00193B16F9|nr:hypothetical protein [Archangium violaceum]QRK06083.1 hypothetical protein JQX13_39075 [Archangium violaceum]